MTDTTRRAGADSSGPSAGLPAGADGPRRRRRRPLRVTLIALGSLLGLVVVAVAGGYAYVNHLASSIPRVKVDGLVVPDSGSAAQTILVTAAQLGPTGLKTLDSPNTSKLFMLLHINAGGKAGGAVTIAGDTVVNVPGHGDEPLWKALYTGGPSLLVKTVTDLTGVPINHYARIDFNHTASLIDAVGGVNVTLSKSSTAFGTTFHAGVNYLTGVTAVYYARDPKLNDAGRLLRQEVLVRDVLTKIGNDHLMTNPVTMVRVLNALKGALTVDSNLTNSEIMALSKQLGGLSSSAATFVTAPTQTVNGKLVINTVLADQLWTAIKQDNIAGFAAKYPSTVTPQIVP